MGRVALALASAAVLLHAVETRTWTQSEASEFEKGTQKGVSISSTGRVSLAPVFKEVYDASVPQLWSGATDAKGNLYAGGADGQVFIVDPSGKGRVLTTLEGGAVYALAVSPKGELFAATSPDAKIYRVAADGKSTVFSTPKSRYIWALVFDAQGTLYAAAGDPGQILRISPNGDAAVVFDAEEAHVRSLAIDAKGNLIAGTEPSGLVLRVSPKGEGFVLHQSGKREVSALAVAKDGAIYAAASGNRGPAAPPPIVPAPAPTPAPTAAAATPAQPGQQQAASTVRPIASAPPSLGPSAAGVAGGSEIYRIAPDGEPRRVWSDPRSIVYSLAFDRNGLLIAGTGNEGKILRIDSDLESTLLVEAEPMQVTSIVPAANGALYAITANAGTIYRLGPEIEKQGTLESDIFDASVFTYWGRLRWEGEARGGSITVETRSGNLDRAQKYWSPWAAVDAAKGGRVPSPPARFLGWRVTLTAAPNGASPQLSLVDVAYQAKNVAPVIEKIEVAPANYKFPAPSLATSSSNNLSLGPIGQPRRPGPSAPNVEPAGAVTLSYEKAAISARWRASDANGDTLRYKVEIRGVEEQTWKLLQDDLKENRVTFDSLRYADGRYRLRVTANDATDNYPGFALTAAAESDVFIIDNTAPRIENFSAAVEGKRIRIRFKGVDNLIPLMSAQFSVNGGDWTYMRPATGITDSLEHEYEAAADLPAGGETVIAVKLSDENDNVTVHKAVLRP